MEAAMKTINENRTEVPGVFVPIKRESPQGRQHLHTMEAGAWLPFAMATLTGLIFGVVSLALASLWRARHPWNWGISVSVIAMGFTWLQLIRHWFSLTALEEVTGLDLNRDGVVGEPEKQAFEDNPRVIKVHLDETKQDGHWQQTRFELHATDDQMRLLAEGMLELERPFTVREWCGAGRPFSGEEFARLRSEMIRNGLIEQASEKDPRRGYLLTKAGTALLADYLEE
jgi:hypothetical protein